MALSIGIVGLPNVGKSTLFNAITNAVVEAQNYPFCTIEPNVGVVAVPDPRLKSLSDISGSSKVLPATIEFVDIAGLVKGASKGEGLGNQFLANIRETSAIAHVVRCFEDDNIVHVHGKLDPIDDIEVINLELILADHQTVQKLIDGQARKAKANEKEEKRKLELFKEIEAHLAASNPVRTLSFEDEDLALLKAYPFLTSKKVIYVANVAEDQLDASSESVERVKSYAASHGDEFMLISAKIEEELSQLEEAEKKEYLDELGLEQSGLDRLAKASFTLLGLQTYLTTGEKETRAWTIRVGDTAPKAAGVIHTDFENGFIRANIISYDDYVACKGLKEAKEKGLVRQEGKDYVMQDGDVVEFLFNV